MKLKKVFLGASAMAVSLLGLASCDSEVTLKGEYQNLDGEAKEVEIKKSDDEAVVLDTLKYLAYKGENTSVDINTLSAEVKMYMDGSMYSSKYNADLTTKMIVDMGAGSFSCKVGGKITAKGENVDMDMGMYSDGNYLYYDYRNGKFKLGLSQLDAEYSEMLDKLKDFCDESNLKSAFNFIGIKQNSRKTAFETIMDNEDAIKDYISTNNLTVSSVTNNYIYLTFNLDSEAILRYCKENNQGISGLDSINYISEDDKMSFVIGFDTTYYYPSYVKTDFDEAGSLLKAISGGVSLNSYAIEMWYSVNKESVATPSDLSEYKDYSYFM